MIRRTALMAERWKADWHAIYVETPRLQRLPSTQRERILNALKLASDLGAVTEVIAARDIARSIGDYAQRWKATHLILGRVGIASRLRWRSGQAAAVARQVPNIDLIMIGTTKSVPPIAKRVAPNQAELEPLPRYTRHILVAVGAGLLAALAAAPLPPYLELSNIAMLFLIPVMLISMRYGRSAAIVTTLTSVAAFDFFFVSPRFSFAVVDWQYAITFVVMLVVGLVAGQLTAILRYQASVATHRESRSRALYEFARAMSGTLEIEQIFAITRDFIRRTFQAQTVLLLPDDAGRLQTPRAVSEQDMFHLTVLDLGIAQWAFDHAAPAGVGTDMLPSSSHFYMPLVTPMRTRGILAIRPESRQWTLIPEQRRQLDTFAALAAIALERVHYVEVAQDAVVKMESERLRNSLLAALSHDLRTPLTSLVGMSESLALSTPKLSSTQQEMADVLREESARMSNMVSNLLDMARIQSGQIKLNLQWQPLEEVVGCALRACKSCLGQHEVHVSLAAELPLIRFDAALIERVLCNLLENAAKYTAAGSRISIAANVDQPFAQINISDNGHGIAAGCEEAIFEKFSRGERKSATSGVGLGLTICRAIVEAHGGTIRAISLPQGGASFMFTLPLGTPPSLSAIDDIEVLSSIPLS